MKLPHLTFVPLAEKHIATLTAIMTRAFDDDAQRYRGCEHDGPPGYDDGSFLRKWGLEAGSASYALMHGDKLVGGVILFLHENGREGTLGCLFIDSTLHGQGLGKAAWQQVEALFPAVRTWHTETPALSFRNHCFYINSCGFRVVEVTDPQSPMDAQFRMVKQLPPAGD